MANTRSLLDKLRQDRASLVLAFLLTAAFLLGGGSRGDIASLAILRPLAIVCLGLGCLWVTRDTIARSRRPLYLMAALICLVGLHLVPLPPTIWTNLPGRELATEASALMGLENEWRPISLNPYSGWNTFYALFVPASAMVLASQLSDRENLWQLYVIIGLVGLSALLGVLQVTSGYNRSFFLYRISNFGNPVGLFANKNHQAAALAMALPMIAVFASRARGSSQNILRIGAAITATALIILVLIVGSRAGVVFAMLAALGSWQIISARPGRNAKPFASRANLVIGIGASIVLATLAAVVALFSKAEALDRLFESGTAEENRVDVWREMLDFGWDYQPIGSGFGSFVEVFQVHEPVSMVGLNYWNHAHNDWLEWLLEGGIPIAILLAICVYLWIRGTRSAWRQRHAGHLSVQLAMVGSVNLFILGLWSLVDYPIRVPSLACIAALSAVWLNLPNARRQARHSAA